MFYVPTPVPGSATDEFKTDLNSVASVSSLNDYETDLQRLSDNEISFIRTYSLAGNLRLSKIRSIYWRVLLGILPESSSEWVTSLRTLRREYIDVKNTFTLDPHSTSSIPDDNPLSLDRNSIWNKYFCDQELRRFIRQDVTRTCTDRKLFQLPDVHDRLVDILFFYARRNPDICYRQGMHELLVPIVSILYADCDNFVKENPSSVIDSTLLEILDLNYLDHDAFSLFSYLMKHTQKFYEIDVEPNSSGYFPLQKSINESYCYREHLFEDPINIHLNEIQDELRKYDQSLHDHLKALDIHYSVFGIRWLRLLYGREFSFDNLLVLWDAIFAFGSDFVLVKYVSLALIIIQRQKLLVSDEIQCLKYLMKCPCPIDVMLVINYALYLNDPTGYQKPTIPTNSGETSSPVDGDYKIVPLELVTNQHIPKNTAAWTKMFKNKKTTDRRNPSSDDPLTVIDDYSTRSFAMLVSELKHMRLVMSLCKMKLMQYHDMLAKSVPTDDAVAARALEGITEICQFLDVDHFSLKSTPASGVSDVETAHEAKEVNVSQTERLSKSNSHPTLDVVASFLPPPNTDVDMLLFNYSESESSDPSRYPLENPVQFKP